MNHRQTTGNPTYQRSILAALSLAVGLAGCSFQLPVAVTDIRSQELREPTDWETQPLFDLRLHPDGLGWRVMLARHITTIVSVRGEERWRYRRYDLAGRQRVPDSSNYDDLCAVALVTSPLLAPFDIDHPPYWTKWDRLLNLCGRRASADGAVSESRERQFRTYHVLGLEPETEGHLSLVWNAEGLDPVRILIPLTHNTVEQGLDVRLRWLAEQLRRKGIQPELYPPLSIELQLVQNKRVMLRRPLMITRADFTRALLDDRMVVAPLHQWPTPFVVRIERDSRAINESERMHLLTRTALLLQHLAVPVVLRGAEMEDIRQLQAKALLPGYADDLPLDVGRLAGATALLHLDVHQPYSQARVLTLSVIKIETGEILATLTAGGHESQWPHIVETTILQLDSVLQGVLPHLPATKVSAHHPRSTEGRP